MSIVNKNKLIRQNIKNTFNSNVDPQVSKFGEVLRSTREKHGISINEVSSELRVREDILVAIEESDFSKIPPQGYSRNMIKSYARLLGLNANKITDMFLDAEYSYQLGKKRASVQNITEENKKRVPDSNMARKSGFRTPREQLEREREQKRSLPIQEESKSSNNSPFGSRTMHVYGNKYKNTPRARREQDKNTEISRGRKTFRETKQTSRDLLEGDDYSSAKSRLEARRRNRLSENNTSSNDVNPFSAEGVKSKSRGLRSRQKIGRNESNTLSDSENPNNITDGPKRNSEYQFMNVYHNKNNSTQSRFTVPVIAGAVVVLIIVLILIFFFVGKQHETDKTDVSKLNVVGISDIEKSDNQQDNNNNNNNTNVEQPKEIEFKFKVKDGAGVYIEIYENNSSRPTLAREVNSSETNTFKVTDTLKFVCTRPSSVDVYVNNELVQPTDANGTGVYTYTVNYNEYMTQ